MHLSWKILSPYQKDLLDNLDVKAGVKFFHDKTNYVVHHRNLQLYFSLGMQMTKLHKVIAFQQCPLLEPYIDFNTEKRKEAKNGFEKDFFKLINNSVFGKIMENLRKRVDIQRAHSEKRLHKWNRKLGFKSTKIFNNDLAFIELTKQKIVLNKTIYVSFSILDLWALCTIAVYGY